MSQRLTDEELNDLSHVTRKSYLGLSEEGQIAFARKMRGGADGPRIMASKAASSASPVSLMRTVGMGGFWISLLALPVGFFMSLTQGYVGIILLVLGSGVGLFAFMWMLGAIEMRLIQINETLKGRKAGTN